MANLEERVRRLALDGVEVKAMTGWSQSMVNDYLGIQEAITDIAAFLAVEPFRIIGATGQPAFKNSWTNQNVNIDAGFYKDPFNRVLVQGQLASGSSGAVAFTLPEGYRPIWNSLFPVIQGGGTGVAYVQVNANGDVIPVGTAVDTFVDIGVLNFYAAQ